MLNKNTLEFVITKKPHEVSKALEMSFRMGPIPLLQFNLFGNVIEKEYSGGQKLGLQKKLELMEETICHVNIDIYNVILYNVITYNVMLCPNEKS